MSKPLPFWVKFFEGLIIVMGLIAILLALAAINTRAKADPPGVRKGSSQIITSAKTITIQPEPVVILSHITEPVAKVTEASKTTRRAPTTPKTNIPSSEVITRLKNASNAQGWHGAEYEALLWIIKRESGFNPNAVNKKSGACGLFQAYPCSKLKSMDIDYQINWGINYIKKRYGSPLGAQSFWLMKGWY